jgi:hypothetical protein
MVQLFPVQLDEQSKDNEKANSDTNFHAFNHDSILHSQFKLCVLVG